MSKENEMNGDNGQTKFREFVDHKILNRLGLKLISLAAAIIVWMVIINIDDPYKVKSFTVPVETINEDALESVNKVYEIIEGNTAQVRVRGKKSVIDKLRASDIRATADLSNLSAVNAVPIVPELVKTVSSEPTLECNQVLKVSLEDMAKKQVQVNVVQEGTPEEGFFVGQCTAKPNMIEITGGESAIRKIDEVMVTLNVDGVSRDFSRRLEPVACDEDGNIVESSTLQYSVKKIRVSASILQTKYIDVNVEISGKPAEGYEFVEAACLPERIEVAGTAKALEGISQVTIPISIEGMRSSSSEVEQNIGVQDYLSEGITVLGDYALVSLKITIERLEEKTITVSADSIKFASLEENLQAEPVNPDDTVELVVRGRSSVLDALPNTAFTAYVDCGGLTQGRYTLPVVSDLGTTYQLVHAGKLQVRIRRKRNGDGDSAPTQKPGEGQKPEMETGTPVPQGTLEENEGQDDE